MITVTETAAEKFIEQILNIEGAVGIRVGVMGGGCSGLQYHLDFAMEQRDDDHVYDDKGITILVDPKSHLYLSGTTIDYVTDLMQSGFKFINPAACRTCGCGESFSC